MNKIIFFISITFVTADNNASSKLIAQVVDVINQHYNHQFETTVVWTNNHSEDVNDFLMKFSGSVTSSLLNINNNKTLNKFQRLRCSQTVFFATEIDEFKTFLNLVSEQLKFHIRLVLVLNKSVAKQSELSTFMEIAWQNNLADIVIINKNEKGEIMLSTYFPYNHGICGNYFPVTLKSNENIFPQKFKNFNRCPIRVSVRPHPPMVDIGYRNDTYIQVRGYDGLVLNIVKHRLNASLDITLLSHYGYCLNGTATGGFSDLVKNISDLLVPGGVLTHATYTLTQASHGYYDSNIRWIGPKRRVIYHSMKLLLPFLDSDSFFFSLAFISFVIVAILIKRFALLNKSRRYSIWITTFALMTGQTIKCVTSVPLLNNLFLLWIWFSFIIRIEYGGSLVNSLQTEMLEPPLSVEDASTNMYGFGGFMFVFEFYKDTPLENDFMVMVQRNFNCYLNRVVKGHKYLLASDALTFTRARKSIQVLDEPISSAMTCLYMRPGWPAAKALDSVIFTLLEVGITDKIFIRDDKLQARRYHLEEKLKAHGVDVSMINSCIYAMCIMWLVCFMIFLLEIIHSKYIKFVKSSNRTYNIVFLK